MTFFEHKTVFWVALWPCLAVFCVAYGAMFHHWFVASIAGVWILVAVFMTAMLHLLDRPEAVAKTESQPEKADVTIFMYYVNFWLATHVSVAVFVLISGILERRYIIASIGGLWLLSMLVEMGHACWKEWRDSRLQKKMKRTL